MNEIVLRKLGLALALLVPATAACQEDVESKPGLVATFEDGKSKITVVRPTISVKLNLTGT